VEPAGTAGVEFEFVSPHWIEPGPAPYSVGPHVGCARGNAGWVRCGRSRAAAGTVRDRTGRSGRRCVAALLGRAVRPYGYHRDELYSLAAVGTSRGGTPTAASGGAGGEVAVAVGAGLARRAAATIGPRGGRGRRAHALLTRELGGKVRRKRWPPPRWRSRRCCSRRTPAQYHDVRPAAWALLLWLVVRVLRTGDRRLLVVCGVVAGIGLLNKDLVAFLVAAVGGDRGGRTRRLLASPWLWAGGPWPPSFGRRTCCGRPITAGPSGGSAARSRGLLGSSQPRSLFLPLQLGLVRPWLAPIWIAGLVRLFRDPALRWCRALGWPTRLLAVVFLVLGANRTPRWVLPVAYRGWRPAGGRLGTAPPSPVRSTVLGAAVVLTAAELGTDNPSVVPSAPFTGRRSSR